MSNSQNAITMLEDIVDDIINRVIKNECPAKLANAIIDTAVNNAKKRGLLTDKAYTDLYARADRKKGHKGRTLVQFFIDIKESCQREDQLCEEIVTLLKSRGETASYKKHGNNDNGRVRIVNYKSEPDIVFTRNGKSRLMDVKNLHEQTFKIGDLRGYADKRSGMIIKSQGSFYIYPLRTVLALIKFGEKEPYVLTHPLYHKQIVKVGNRGEKGVFPLQNLLKDGWVEEIPLEKKNDK